MNKTCNKCGAEKPEKFFGQRGDRPGKPRRKNTCRTCEVAKYYRVKRQWLDEYLVSHPCVYCGEADIDVLEFDHRDPKQKRNRVAKAGRVEMMAAEAAKCDVRCANCHRRRHARERRLNALRKANLVLSHN